MKVIICTYNTLPVANIVYTKGFSYILYPCVQSCQYYSKYLMFTTEYSLLITSMVFHKAFA